jgi:hypothetical protein
MPNSFAASRVVSSSGAMVSGVEVLLGMGHPLPIAGRKIENVSPEDIAPPANLPHA